MIVTETFILALEAAVQSMNRDIDEIEREIEDMVGASRKYCEQGLQEIKEYKDIIEGVIKREKSLLEGTD